MAGHGARHSRGQVDARRQHEGWPRCLPLPRAGGGSGGCTSKPSPAPPPLHLACIARRRAQVLYRLQHLQGLQRGGRRRTLGTCAHASAARTAAGSRSPGRCPHVSCISLHDPVQQARPAHLRQVLRGDVVGGDACMPHIHALRAMGSSSTRLIWMHRTAARITCLHRRLPRGTLPARSRSAAANGP